MKNFELLILFPKAMNLTITISNHYHCHRSISQLYPITLYPNLYPVSIQSRLMPKNNPRFSKQYLFVYKCAS